MKLRWTRRARADLREIREYIARDDATAARKHIERLRERARLAAEMPESGRVVPELRRDDVREVFVGRYRIVYLVGRDVVDVLVVFEGSRLFPGGRVPPDR